MSIVGDGSNIFNKEDGTLPFGLFEPTSEGKIVWICNYDAEMKITSVFVYDDGVTKRKIPSYHKELSEATFIRDELVNAGWKKLVPPKATFTYPDAQGKQRELNRKQKRHLQRKLKKIHNPFEEEEKLESSLVKKSEYGNMVFE